MQFPSENRPLDAINSDAVIGSLLPRDSGDAWPESLRLTALGIAAETGSTQAASRETGIPRGTIERWVASEDGALFTSQLRQAIRVNTAHKLIALVNRNLELANDRLNTGNSVLDARGNLRYVPVPYKDLVFAASIFIDKHALVTGALANGKTSDQLGKLADQLTKLLSANNAQPSAPVAQLEPDEPLIG